MTESIRSTIKTPILADIAEVHIRVLELINRKEIADMKLASKINPLTNKAFKLFKAGDLMAAEEKVGEARAIIKQLEELVDQ